jgi:hypothetical protein
VFVARSDVGNPSDLTPTPALSPDGRAIVFERDAALGDNGLVITSDGPGGTRTVALSGKGTAAETQVQARLEHTALDGRPSYASRP